MAHDSAYNKPVDVGSMLHVSQKPPERENGHKEGSSTKGSPVAIGLLAAFGLLLMALFCAFCIYCKCQCD